MTTITFSPEGSGPCAKQVVKATVIAASGVRYVGTNHCMTPQATCARAGMPSGVGYDLCKSVCNQDAHAEVNAIRVAGSEAKGATLYLEGHTYACAPCMDAAEAAGVAKVIIGAPPEESATNTAELVVKVTALIRQINEATAQGFRNEATVALARDLAVEAMVLAAMAEQEFENEQ
jgi:tRNA(Arg) A34 adenosine deaminase TadA